jgi:hypothetical protein
MRRIFGSKRGEVTGEWRKLQNVELNDLNDSSNMFRVRIARKMRAVGGGRGV